VSLIRIRIRIYLLMYVCICIYLLIPSLPAHPFRPAASAPAVDGARSLGAALLALSRAAEKGGATTQQAALLAEVGAGSACGDGPVLCSGREASPREQTLPAACARLADLVVGCCAPVQAERKIGKLRPLEGDARAGDAEAGLRGVAFDVPLDTAEVGREPLVAVGGWWLG
jgi:hypothetical protein